MVDESLSKHYNKSFTDMQPAGNEGRVAGALDVAFGVATIGAGALALGASAGSLAAIGAAGLLASGIVGTGLGVAELATGKDLTDSVDTATTLASPASAGLVAAGVLSGVSVENMIRTLNALEFVRSLRGVSRSAEDVAEGVASGLTLLRTSVDAAFDNDQSGFNDRELDPAEHRSNPEFGDQRLDSGSDTDRDFGWDFERTACDFDREDF